MLLLGTPGPQLGSAERGELLGVDAAIAGPHRVAHLGTKEGPQGIFYDRVHPSTKGRSSPTGTLDQLGVDLYGNLPDGMTP